MYNIGRYYFQFFTVFRKKTAPSHSIFGGIKMANINSIQYGLELQKKN